MLSGGWSRRKRVFIYSAANLEQTSHRLTSRFFLGLRAITSREVPTQAETSPFVWRRTIIDFEMGKASHSGATPSERDVRRTELVDQEVMELQVRPYIDKYDLGIKDDI